MQIKYSKVGVVVRKAFQDESANRAVKFEAKSQLPLEKKWYAKCIKPNFVHTARRYYRLNGLVRSSDWSGGGRKATSRFREDDQT
jgi:hypothetical protein